MTAAAAVRGVVLGGTGGLWRVRTDGGETLEASLRGRLKQEFPRAASSPRSPLKLTVGDDVLLECAGGPGIWVITGILPRRSRLARRAPGGGPGERVLAANVDQVVVVFAAARPEPHVRMLDRFLVIAEANHLQARVILNKIDLVDEGAAAALLADYLRAGYPVQTTSVKSGAGLPAVRSMLDGRTSVFTGPSGVGKSSLLNGLFPGAGLRIGEISASVNKGRHTTVGATMLPLSGPKGGYVIDTPGLRELGIAELPAERLDLCFPEFRPHLGRCRFVDCVHLAEPDCAVREAVAACSVGRSRYDSYCKLLLNLREERTPR